MVALPARPETVAGRSAEEVVLVTWVRCFDGTLLHLDQAMVYMTPDENGYRVVARTAVHGKVVILKDVPRDVAEAAMERLFARTVGYGETNLDFRAGKFLEPNIPQDW